MSNESTAYTGPIPVTIIGQMQFSEAATHFDAAQAAHRALHRAPFNALAAAQAPSVGEQQGNEVVLQRERAAMKHRAQFLEAVATLPSFTIRHPDDSTCCGRCETPAAPADAKALADEALANADKLLSVLQQTAELGEKPAEPQWIEWNGGLCPVATGAKVEVRLRVGKKRTGGADSFDWSNDGDHPGDITAYRVIDAGKQPEKAAEAPKADAATPRARMADGWTMELDRSVTLRDGSRMTHAEWCEAMKPDHEPADPAPTAANFLTAAGECMGARAAEYDQPGGERSVPAVVTAFNAITGHNLTDAQGWCFLALLKQVRLFSAEGFHRDSAVDGVAYSALMAEAKAQEAA